MKHSNRRLGRAGRALVVLTLLSNVAWAGVTLRETVDRFVRAGQSVDLGELLALAGETEGTLREAGITYSMVRSQLVAEWLLDGEVVCRSELDQGLRRQASCRFDAPLGRRLELRLGGASGQLQLLEAFAEVEGDEVSVLTPEVGTGRTQPTLTVEGRRATQVGVTPRSLEAQPVVPRDTKEIRIPRRARRVWLPLSAGESQAAFSRGGPMLVFGPAVGETYELGELTRHYVHLDIPISGLPSGTRIERVLLYVRLGPGSGFEARLSRWAPVEQEAEVLGTFEEFRPWKEPRDPAPREVRLSGSSGLEIDPSRFVYTIDVTLTALSRAARSGQPSVGVVELRGVAVEYE